MDSIDPNEVEEAAKLILEANKGKWMSAKEVVAQVKNGGLLAISDDQSGISMVFGHAMSSLYKSGVIQKRSLTNGSGMYRIPDDEQEIVGTEDRGDSLPRRASKGNTPLEPKVVATDQDLTVRIFIEQRYDAISAVLIRKVGQSLPMQLIFPDDIDDVQILLCQYEPDPSDSNYISIEDHVEWVQLIYRGGQRQQIDCLGNWIGITGGNK